MASTINASTSSGIVATADTSGVLNIQTAGTTAMSVSAAQVVDFTNAPTVAGAAVVAAATPTVLGTVYGSTLSGAASTAALGYQVLNSSTGLYNASVGWRSGFGNTSGTQNAFFGYATAYANTTGSYNIAIGPTALYTNTTGSYNTAVGIDALRLTTTGSNNIAVGYQALYSNTTQNTNIAIGSQTLYSSTTGGQNTAVGDGAAYTNTTGSSLTAVGFRAARVYAATSGENAGSTFVGWQSGFSTTTGVDNTFVGGASGYSNTTGTTNVAMGRALYNNSTGSSSTAIGYTALYNATTGSGNTAIGYQSGISITTGSKNTILGSFTGNQGGLDIRTAGNYIVFSDGDGSPRGMFNSNGYFEASPSGGFPDGTNLTYHYFSSPVSAGGSADKVLNVRADSASFAGSALAVRGNRNTTNGSFNTIETRNGNDTGVFAVRDSGNAVNTNNSYGAISDVVLKENIVDATPKLASLNQVQIRSYNLKAKPDEKHIGVIAQELEAVFPGLVETDNEGIKNVKYSVFVPMLIKAVQELTAANTALAARVAQLETK
jgi:hypothetical protein